MKPLTSLQISTKKWNTDFVNFGNVSDPERGTLFATAQFHAYSRHSIKDVEWMDEGMHKCPLWICRLTFPSLSLDDLRSTSSK